MSQTLTEWADAEDLKRGTGELYEVVLGMSVSDDDRLSSWLYRTFLESGIRIVLGMSGEWDLVRVGYPLRDGRPVVRLVVERVRPITYQAGVPLGMPLGQFILRLVGWVGGSIVAVSVARISRDTASIAGSDGGASVLGIWGIVALAAVGLVGYQILARR